MSLYIGGAQCVYGIFKDEDDWEIFDELEKKMTEIAKKHNVEIDRRGVNDGDNAFVVLHPRKNKFYDVIYAGEVFEYDFKVETSEDFEVRSKAFIAELESSKDFEAFHDLKWTDVGVRYFVIS